MLVFLYLCLWILVLFVVGFNLIVWLILLYCLVGCLVVLRAFCVVWICFDCLLVLRCLG